MQSRDHGASTAFRLDGTYSLDGGILKSIQAGFRYEGTRRRQLLRVDARQFVSHCTGWVRKQMRA